MGLWTLSILGCIVLTWCIFLYTGRVNPAHESLGVQSNEAAMCDLLCAPYLMETCPKSKALLEGEVHLLVYNSTVQF